MKVLVDSIPMTGLVTGICRHMRSLYGEVERIPGVSTSYFNGKRVLDRMPPHAEAGKWIRTTAAVWKLPDPAVVALRCVHWTLFEARLRARCREARYDVYHETAFVPAAVTSLPVVYSIYDLSLIKFRHMHPRERVWFFDLYFKRRLRYARHFFTSTEYTKSEVVEMLGVSPERITAIPLAHSPIFFPRPAERVREVLAANGWPTEYVLFVGSLEPRKNLQTLVKALEASRCGLPLVIVGWEGWGDKDWLEYVGRRGLRDRVVMAGYVNDETLACLYTGASVFVYPSFYEGFGLPILEAMACGCPVICSNTTSMPEVAGDAAILFDPHCVEELAAALDRMTGDSALRDGHRSGGLRRAASFGWDRTAARTVEVFRQVAEESRR